jgi:hypothetical protein
MLKISCCNGWKYKYYPIEEEIVTRFWGLYYGNKTKNFR